MAGLLYYVPARQSVSLDQVAELGLAYAFEADCTPRGCPRGPDGAAGVVFADAGRLKDRELGYFAAAQTWLEIPGNPAGVWVGRFTDQPTLPADLLRAQTLPGHEVKLADGQAWLVPVARCWAKSAAGTVDPFCLLPQKTTIDAEGNWTQGDVVDRCAELWAVACRFWDVFWAEVDGEPDEEVADAQRVEFDFAGLNDAAVTVLAANYRLAKAEVALLGLLDSDAPREILLAAIDWPTIVANSKKKESAQPAAA